MHHQLFFSEKRQQKGVLDQVLCLLYAASHAVRQFKHFFHIASHKENEKNAPTGPTGLHLFAL